MKFIIQHDERDCGAACLSMIAAHYGLKHTISKYRELTKTDCNGTNLYGLVDGANKIGLNAEALSGTPEELFKSIKTGEIKIPFIAHIITEDSMQHFVVVFNIKNGKLIIGDPAKGKVKYTYEHFCELWTGYIVTFNKTADFEKGNFKKGEFIKFFSLLKDHYKILISVIIMSLIISFVGIIGSFVFQVIIDDFYNVNEIVICDDNCTEEHEHVHEESHAEVENIFEKILIFITNHASNYNLFFGALIGLYILQALIQYSRGYLISVLSKNIDIKLIMPYYNHIIDLPIKDINTRNTGEYLSRFSDASTIRDAISGATLTLFLDAFMVAACGGILFAQNKVLFFISLSIVILYAIVVLFYRKPIKNINREVMENNARVQTYLKESIDGVEMIKAHRNEKIAKEKNAAKFKKLISAVFKENVVSVSQDTLCGLIELAGIVLILWVGFGMVQNKVLTIGALMTYYALLAYFIGPIKNLIALQPMMQTAIVAAERLNDILDIKTEDKDITINNIEFNTVGFKNVSFRYGNQALTLKNISLDIKKGERIAIVGESGCGKTTLVKLLLKFYENESGDIFIDNYNLKELSIEEIRNEIAYIDQNTFLFSDTIKNNLLVGKPNADDKEIKNACDLASASDFIEKLPFKYDTYLDENGKNLSGGQRQRLAIARALLKNPKLLILDEATSNLDTITENAIKNTIFKFNKDMTCIIIAHRLSTIKNCDRIVVMENGRILEIGTHNELLDLKGKYFELYNNQ